MKLKIYIQAVRPGKADPETGKPRDEERMISYEFEGVDPQEAAAKARARFDLEERMHGWEIAGMGTLTL